MIEPLPCLLWDVDGTMVDTTALIAAALDFIYQKYFQRTLSYDDRRALIGTPLKKQIRIFGDLEALGVDEQAITEDFILYYEKHRDEERILEAVTAILIEGKRRGLPTALVTSKNREELTNTLPRLGIADYVDVAITADDVTHPKPDPEGLFLAMQRLGIPIELAPRAVYIGDTVHDMRAAKAANVRGIAVTWGAAPRASLEAESPAFLCDTPEQLLNLLFQTD
jgi:HAD superfamily hydrolase (TIGR01549 family)